ncbi:BnaCnng32070D, partial [Brassica napus]
NTSNTIIQSERVENGIKQSPTSFLNLFSLKNLKSSSFSWTRETSSKMRIYGITLLILAEKQGKSMIVAGFTEPKKDHGYELIEKLEAGVQNMLQIVEDRKRDTVAPKQKEILLYVEEDMVDGFPYEVPAECINMHLIKGRATVVLDGYNAPVTARNFVDLVERHFYDCMEIQRCKTSNFPHNIYIYIYIYI